MNEAELNSSFLSDFVIGGVTGSLGKTIFAPLERVKLLLQTQDANYKLSGRKYRGIIDCLARVYREEGIRAFWKGNFPNMLHYFPTAAFNFAFKDQFHKIFGVSELRNRPQAFFWANVAAGGAAGAACNLLIFPLKLARLCMGVDVGTRNSKAFYSLFNFYRQIYREKGIRGWYSGLCNSLVSVFVFRGVHFGLFDTGKVLWTGYEEASVFQKLCIGHAVTVVAEEVTYPSDTLKRRMMMNGFQKGKVYQNSWSCFVTIWREEGLRGFFKGNMSNLLKSGCNAIILVLYDITKRSWTKIR